MRRLLLIGIARALRSPAAAAAPILPSSRAASRRAATTCSPSTAAAAATGSAASRARTAASAPTCAASTKDRFLAGELPNDPENAVRWIMDPRKIQPDTLMPDLGVTEGEARDIAAYLYTQ